LGGYGGFARVYDRLTENVPYAEMARQIVSYTERFGGKKGILLDLACGTGSLSEELARQGFDVIGVDSSEEMLNCALDKKFDSGLPIQYLRQDMRSLDMFGTIDVTVCTLDGINHLESAADVLRAFERVSLFCDPDGLFIFDVNTLHKHRDVLADNAFIYSLDGLYCGWQNEYDPADSSVRIFLDIFEENGGTYERCSEDFREIYLPHDEIANLLEKAGLKLLAVYDNYTDEPTTETSERAVYVCKKVNS
jgi:ubiquinone/menaquinone biosynthesis C-methylase UbiE